MKSPFRAPPPPRTPWLDDSTAPNGRLVRENFGDWFGKSKVVDRSGAPRVVYHGTSSNFASFDFTRVGNSSEHHTAAFGMFFTSDPRVASIFNRDADGDDTDLITSSKTRFFDGANIVPAYLSIENPYVMQPQELIDMVEEFGEADVRAMLDAYKRSGHDGIYIPKAEPYLNAELVGDTWVAFRPEQIKSACGNQGDYNASSTCIVDLAPAPKARYGGLSL